MKDIKSLGASWRSLQLPLRCPITNGAVQFGVGVLLLFSSSVVDRVLADTTSPESNVRDLQVVVESGDTLTGIVERALDSLDAWKQVADYNKLSTPDSLAPGDVILIPSKLLNFATIIFTKGQTEHQMVASEEKQAAVKGGKVFIGDVVRTGEDGFVGLVFKGNTTVKIQPESEVRIEQLDCFDKKKSCVINLKTSDGQLNLDVNSEGYSKPTSFSIETPYASAAVRGTDFDFDTRGNSNVLGVTGGKVEISLAGERMDVPVGKGTVAGVGKSIKTLYDIPEKPEFEQAQSVLLSAEDYLSWRKVDGVVRYNATVIDAATSTEIVRSYQGERAAIKTDSVPGDYFLDVRGIDSKGLKGFVARRAIRQQRIDEKAVSPELEMELANDALTITPSGKGPVEVRLGNRLVKIDGDEVLLDYQTYTISGGETFETQINRDQIWYVLGRQIVDDNTVSKYGRLYEFQKNQK